MGHGAKGMERRVEGRAHGAESMEQRADSRWKSHYGERLRVTHRHRGTSPARAIGLPQRPGLLSALRTAMASAS
jgi:hypothetical protein